MAEAEGTGETTPVQNTHPAAAPKPPSRLAARWRGSRPLRIASAVLAAVVIGGLGFGVGLAVGGGDGHHGRNHLVAGHRSWRDEGPRMHREDGPRMHRFERGDRPGDNGSAPGAPAQPPVPPTSTPTPPPTR